jgi:hypothetical protein
MIGQGGTMAMHVRRLAALTLCLSLTILQLWTSTNTAVGADQPAKTEVPKGQRVYSIGHSFHVFMPAILAQIAKSAGIEDHKQVGLSSIGGSYVHQHWSAPEDKFKSKATLESGQLDVLTMAPLFLPDDGIDNFVKLASEKSPNIRILVQEFWLPFDVNKNQIYGRSPIGLPVPAALKGATSEETATKLNQVLQEIAWKTVTEHPLSGVKAK